MTALTLWLTSLAAIALLTLGVRPIAVALLLGLAWGVPGRSAAATGRDVEAAAVSAIPAQPLGKDVCVHCGGAIHLANAQLGPVWLHSNDLEWCPLKAAPAGRSGSEGVAR